jgi:hypothetical protein
MCRFAQPPPICDLTVGYCILPALPAAVPNGPLTHISGSSSTDVWVVRDTDAFALHWNGASWACLPTSLATNKDVWASAAEAWVVGESSAGRPPIYRYRWDGGPQLVAPTTSGWTSLTSVWGDGTSVWVVFADAGAAPSRLDGSGWHAENQAVLSGAVVDLSGQRDGGGTIYGAQTGGQMWHRFDAAMQSSETVSSGDAIAVFTENENVAYAVQRADSGYARNSAGSWVPEALPLVAGDTLHAMSGANGEVYAVANVAGSQGLLLRRDGLLGWQRVFTYSKNFRDVWVAPDAGVWISGNNQTVLYYPPPRCPYSTLPVSDEFTGPALSPGWQRFPAGSDWTIHAGHLEGNSSGMGSTGISVNLPAGFKETSVTVQLVADPMPSTTVGAQFYVSDNATPPNYLKLEVSSGHIHVYVGDPSTDLTNGMKPEPPPGSYLRIQETVGLVLFEYSTDPNGGAWTSLYTQGTPPWAANINHLTLGLYSAVPVTTAPVIFDNLDRCPR